MRMEEIRQILEDSGRDLETNKRMLEDLRRQVDRKAADQRDRKRSNPNCLEVRQGVINEFVENILRSPSPSARVPVKCGYGDVAVDVHLYENAMRTDYDVFEALYGVDVGVAASVVESNCDDIQTLLDDMAEKRLEGAEISNELCSTFDELVESLKEMEEIPRRLDPGSRASRACSAVKRGLGTPEIDIYRVLNQLRQQPGYFNESNYYRIPGGVQRLTGE